MFYVGGQCIIPDCFFCVKNTVGYLDHCSFWKIEDMQNGYFIFFPTVEQ